MKELPIEEVKSSDNSNKLKLAFGLVVLFLVASFVIRWLLALVVPILLFANRDIVMRLLSKIVNLYKEDTLKGLGASILAFFLFTPFTIFLFFRTVYYMVSGNDFPIPDAKKTIIDISPKQKEKPATTTDTGGEDRMMSLEEIRQKLNEDDDFS